jgi:Tol biopolymer transport system component
MAYRDRVNRRRARHTATAAAVLTLACIASPAPASFPGRNGPLVVSLGGCTESTYLAVTPWRDAGPLRPLTRCSESRYDAVTPAAAPDGRTVLAARTDPRGILQVDVRRARVRRLPLPRTARWATNPSFAPSGERFAFEQDYVIWTANVDGSRTRRLTDNEPCSRRGCYGLENPSWSPDGALIAVSAFTGGSRPALTPGLWLIRARDGAAVRQLAASRADVYDYDWAPDGSSLVVATRGGLYSVPRTGGEWQLLVADGGDAGATAPVWSPDGRWIEWVSIRIEGPPEDPDVWAGLWRIPAAGGTPERVRRLPRPPVIDGFHTPELAWLARP